MKYGLTSLLASFVLGLWLLPPLSWAGDAADALETFELRVSPAAEPRPALKYRLKIPLSERKPGNAATHYYRAIILQRQLPKEVFQEHADKYEIWHRGPRGSFPKEEVAKWLEKQHNVFAEIKEGAYREHCDWDLRIQDLRGPELYSLLLPEIQECRELARSLSLKARYEMLDGKPDAAFETLRQGYQLARDAAQEPFIVSGLVGVAIASVMNEDLRQLLEFSDVNYYWAIASLPQPAADLRPALEFEVNSSFQAFPFLRDAETAQRTPEQWRQIIVDCMRELTLLGGKNEFADWQGELAAAGLMAKLYPVSKQALLDAGFDREKVAAMPVGQVVAIHTARATEELSHDMLKPALLPYHEALARSFDGGNRLAEPPLVGAFGLPIAHLLMPAVNAAFQAQARVARNVAALQAIEALRMHAAASGGKLPLALAEVKIVPVPDNPATGQPFPYRFDAASGTAPLELPAVGGRDAKRYVIRLR